MAFKDNLKRLRKEAGQTQEQLALACGWNGQSRVANYEKGLREPSLDELPVLAKALGTTVSALLGGPAAPSQPAGLDHAKLDIATRFLEDLFAQRKRVFDYRAQSLLIARVYDDLTRSVPLNVVELTMKYGPQLAGEDDDERKGKVGSTGTNDRGGDGRRAKKAAVKTR